MKMKISLISFFIISTCLLLACNISGISSGTSNETKTPNLTLTSLFAPPISVISATIPHPSGTNTPKPSPITTETPTLTKEVTTTPSQSPSTTQTASPTPTFTNTTEPTASACYRQVEIFDASYFRNPPVIDGVWDEWDSLAYPVDNITYGAGNWKGNNDLSASFRVGWDSNYLYVAAKVWDNKYVQNASGDDLYKGDSIEILIDSDLCGDYYYSILSNDDYQLGISPGKPNVNGEKEAFLWFPSGLAGGRSNVIIGSVGEDGLYRIEVAIPWSVFGTYPYYGETYGFVFSVSDNDNPHKNVQEKLASSVSTRRLTNPTTWGTLVLK